MRRREFLSVIVGATVWPLAARAQQSATPVVVLLDSATFEANALLCYRVPAGYG